MLAWIGCQGILDKDQKNIKNDYNKDAPYEGLDAIKTALIHSKKLKMEMPILQASYDILFNGKDKKSSALNPLIDYVLSEYQPFYEWYLLICHANHIVMYSLIFWMK